MHPSSLLTTYELERCGSTNTEIEQYINEDDPIPVLLIAREQTAGKGQRGKIWNSPKGKGWYFSLYLPGVNLLLDRLPVINWVVSLEVINLLEEMGLKQLFIKWPNDIFTHNGKLGGILIENQLHRQEIYSLTIGIGINEEPIEADKTLKGTTSLRQEKGMNTPLLKDRVALIKLLCQRIARRIYQPVLKKELIHQDLIKYLYGMDRWFSFEMDGDVFKAQIIGMDTDGMLILHKGDESMRVHSGSLNWLNEL